MDAATVRLTLRPTPPFSLRHTLARLRSFRPSAVVRTFEGGGVRFALRALGRTVIAEVRDGPTDDTLDCTLTPTDAETPGVDLAAVVHDAVGRLRYHLGLDDDLAPFYSVGAEDPAFAPVLEALHGYHLTKFTTPFESAVWAVVQQRTPNPFAYRSMAGLVDRLGHAATLDGVRYTAFPEPADLAFDARAAILEATNNTRKTDRLVPLGAAFATADEDVLRTAPFDEVAAWLRRIPGVGAWSIDYVMLRGLGRFERTPWTDTGLLDAVSSVYTKGFAIGRGSAREIAERYGWYQGLWAHYLKVYVYDAPATAGRG